MTLVNSLKLAIEFIDIDIGEFIDVEFIDIDIDDIGDKRNYWKTDTYLQPVTN